MGAGTKNMAPIPLEQGEPQGVGSARLRRERLYNGRSTWVRFPMIHCASQGCAIATVEVEVIQPERCALCGEVIRRNQEIAEMYNPSNWDDDNVVVHYECGLAAGLELA